MSKKVKDKGDLKQPLIEETNDIKMKKENIGVGELQRSKL